MGCPADKWLVAKQYIRYLPYLECGKDGLVVRSCQWEGEPTLSSI